MQVSRINNTNNYNPAYKGISRIVYKQGAPTSVFINSAIKHKNTSWMYRPNLYTCQRIYKCFSQAFKDVSKVNVYNYGCSLGYEAYSYVLWLLSGKKNNPEKFLPIIAKDYDEDIIKEACKLQLLFDSSEMVNIKTVAGENRLNDFFQFGKCSDYLIFGDLYYGTPANLTEKLADKVQFSVADIRDDYKNIIPENSIVMASNFWPYMEKEDRYALAENLYKHLDKGSYIKIDEFDNCKYWLDDKSTAQLLEDVGFKKTAISGFVLKK